MRTRLAIAALVIAIGMPAGTLIFWYAQPTLQADGSFIWWSPVDGRRDVTTQAAGVTQDTVPIRPGSIQGFALTVFNYSDVAQVILGTAGHQISPVLRSRPRLPSRPPARRT